MDEKHYYNDSIFWVEVDRIKANPYQPRRTFEEDALRSLADSIRQYGVLQPLVVTRHEIERDGEGIFVEYELISGERRLRASKIAGVSQVPVVIRTSDETDKMKLELAIIENLQREDLNAVDRAKAFQRLVDEFGMNHKQVSIKVGKSREYVSNSLRILLLSEEIQQALVDKQINEGHTRPLLMLADKPEEQTTLFKEIVDKKMTVRESEQIARRIAVNKARKHDLTPELMTLEREFTESLGTRVRIERKEKGGKVLIDFFSNEDLDQLRALLAAQRQESPTAAETVAPKVGDVPPNDAIADEFSDIPLAKPSQPIEVPVSEVSNDETATVTETSEPASPDVEVSGEGKPAPKEEPEDDLYSVKNFTV